MICPRCKDRELQGLTVIEEFELIHSGFGPDSCGYIPKAGKEFLACIGCLLRVVQTREWRNEIPRQ